MWREQIAISAQVGWGGGASPHLGIAGRSVEEAGSYFCPSWLVRGWIASSWHHRQEVWREQVVISAQVGWGRGASPLLTVETEVNGDLKRTNERGP